MESYVERWKREKAEKEGVTNGRAEEAQNEREGQKAQKHRRVQKEQSCEPTESEGE